jgi:hypothetical protein
VLRYLYAVYARFIGSRFKVQGSRFKVQGSRFKVQGSKVQRFRGSRFRGSSLCDFLHLFAFKGHGKK